MPVVNILVTPEGNMPGTDRTTAEQKAAVYKGTANLLFDVMHKPREDTTVLLHEHEMEDIGQDGLPWSITGSSARRADSPVPDVARQAPREQGPHV